MTINSTNNEIEYTGNEETTIFVFPYKFFSATDLKVKLDGVLQEGGYGVTGMCENTGGEVMFDVAPGIDVAINIKREVPATSEFHPTDFNKLPAESLENAIDRAIVVAGQNQGSSPDLTNALKIPSETGETFITEFPLKDIRANKYMLFDEDGNVGVGTGGSGGDVSSSISSTTDGKVAIFDGITGKIIKDTTITGILKASSGVLAQAISDTDFVSVSAFNTLDGRVGTAETDIGTLETDMTSKAGVDLDNISSAGVAVIQSYATGGANVSLSNLDATGNAKFTNKSNVDLDNISSAGVAVIQSYATGGANVDLSNLSATGEARFTAKANISLDNINSAGIAVIQSYATGGANTDLSNLSSTGNAKFTEKADKTYVDAQDALKLNLSLDNLSTAGTVKLLESNKGFISGFDISCINGATTITVGKGTTVDTTGQYVLKFTEVQTANLTTTFDSGTGLGASAFTGVSSSVHLFIIYNPTTQTTRLFGYGGETPSLPSGYTIYQRIGACRLNNGTFYGMRSSGNVFNYEQDLPISVGLLSAGVDTNIDLIGWSFSRGIIPRLLVIGISPGTVNNHVLYVKTNSSYKVLFNMLGLTVNSQISNSCESVHTFNGIQTFKASANATYVIYISGFYDERVIV